MSNPRTLAPKTSKKKFRTPERETFLIRIDYIGSNSFLNVLPFILLTLTWIFQPTIQLLASNPFHYNSPSNGAVMIELSNENKNDHPTPVKATNNLIDLAGTAKDGNGTPLDGQVATLYNGTVEVASDVIENGTYLMEDILLTGTTLNTDNEFWVNQNFPNPFGASTRINYSLDKNERVRIDILDIQGKYIKTIEDAMKGPGEHSAIIDGNGLSDGVYFGAIKAGDKTIVKKMVHLSGGPEPSSDGFNSGQEKSSTATNSEYQLVISGENFVEKDTILDLFGSGVITVPQLTVYELSLIRGEVYDLDTKWDEDGNRLIPIGIPNMLVYLGSNSEVQTTTDANGVFNLRLPEIPTDLDSIFIVGQTPADTAYYFWKKPAFEITHDTNYITAFNDTTGIPLFTRMWDEEAGIGVLEHIVQASNIANKLIGFEPWEQTTSRFRDEDMQHEVYGNGIRVFMNREITDEWYADSAWAGLKAGEIGRFKFIEVEDIADALVVMKYDHNMVGETTTQGDIDNGGPYMQQAIIRIRGPPGGSVLGELQTVYVVAHEKYHIGYYIGEHSPFLQDNFYGFTSQRINNLMPIEGSEREKRSIEIYWNLERNPKFFHYSSDNTLY